MQIMSDFFAYTLKIKVSRACHHCLRNIWGLRLKIGSSGGTYPRRKKGTIHPGKHLRLGQEKQQEDLDLRRGQNQYFARCDQPFSRKRQKSGTIRKYPFESRTCKGLAIIESHRAKNFHQLFRSKILGDGNIHFAG